jgi:hypothetical protein
METTLVIGQYTGATPVDRLQAEVVPRLRAECPGVHRVTAYRRLDGEDERYDHWLIAELEASEFVGPVTDVLRGSADDVRAYAEVFRMNRTEWGIAQHVPSSTDLDSVPTDLLTIVLPVPEGRSAQWRIWYDRHHMPTVFSIAPGLVIGHRYAPIAPPTDGAHLVLYEFESHERMRAFQDSGTPEVKKNEYFQSWGVRNNRRAFTIEFAA